MTKYQIVGIINVIFGIFQLCASILPYYTISRIGQMYAEFNVNPSPNIALGYTGIGILLVLAVINLVLGVKGLLKSKQKDTYFKYGTISAIVSVLLMIVLVPLMVFSIILPIYNLTEQL